MATSVYEFHQIHSNPNQPGIPRVFFVKKSSGKISWAYEINEEQGAFMDSEFDTQEAEFIGRFVAIEDESCISISGGEDELLMFEPAVVRSIDTMVNHRYSKFIENKELFFVGRRLSRTTYAKREDVKQAEMRYMKIEQSKIDKKVKK